MISVIMPLYKPNPLYLKQSIDSIVSQTYRNWELIVILDPSSSQADFLTTKITSEYAGAWNVRCLKNSRRSGIVASLNRGILSAEGEFIARADGDDICEPNRFEVQLNEMKKRGLDFLGSWAFVIDESCKKIGELRPPVNATSIRKLILFHNPFLHPTMIFRKDALLSVGLYDNRMGHSQDYELCMRLLSQEFRGANIPKYLLNLRENPCSSTRGSKWLETRLDYILAKTYGLIIHGFRTPLDFIFLVTSPAALLISPRMVRALKILARVYIPHKLTREGM